MREHASKFLASTKKILRITGESEEPEEPWNEPDNISKLCRKCWDLTADEKQMRGLLSKGKYVSPRLWHEVSASSQAGCPICLCIFKEMIDLSLEGGVVKFSGDHTELIVAMSDRRGINSIDVTYHLNRRRQRILLSFSIYALKHCPVPGLLRHHASEPLAPTDAIIRKAVRGMIASCLGSHSSGGLPISAFPTNGGHQTRESPFLPSRVVHVGAVKSTSDENSDMVLRLHVSQPNQRADYVTLSYCWGGDQKEKLTRSNVQSYQEQINPHLLSQTIKDAITVVRDMGLQFIWIDALCIIQDDPDDVGKEIAVMGDIYAGSTFTIAAARAKSVKEGFLQGYRCYRNRIAVEGNNELGFLVPFKEKKQEPLSTRAWVFQEQVLSSRILNYGTNGVEWYCLSHSCKTSGVARQIHPSYDVLTRNADHDENQFPSLSRLVHWLNPHQILPDYLRGTFKLTEEWYAAMQGGRAKSGFSSRSLTVGTDKLPAIAGIAARFHEQTRQMISKDTKHRDGINSSEIDDELGLYLAGMWEKHLVFWLSWVRVPQASPDVPTSDVYIAPTWSFACVPYPIQFPDVQLQSEYLNTLTARLIKATVLLEHPDSPFGKILGASIVLRAKVFEAKSTLSQDLESSAPCWEITLDRSSKASGRKFHTLELATIDYDTRDDVLYMQLGWTDFEKPGVNARHRTHGLLLAAKEDGTFRRIGVYVGFFEAKWEVVNGMKRILDAMEEREMEIL